MVLTLWEENGTIKESATGTLIECESCPCGAVCQNCDPGTTPGSVTVTFGPGLNIFGGAEGCDGDCDDFADDGPFELPQLTQAQIDTLKASCSAAFNDVHPVAGCLYGLTEGLPCGATALILEILDGGTAGAGQASGSVTVCWVGENAGISWNIDTDDTDQDCLTNIDTDGNGIGAQVATITSDDPPCDFDWILFDQTLLDLVANP